MESKRPNILVTGTPGTGKTTLCELLAQTYQLNYVHVGTVIKENRFVAFNEELQCDELDEDALLDHLEVIMNQGGNVVEHHESDLFPLRWFSLVVVLRADNTVLYDRLQQRGYPLAKIQENCSAEICRLSADMAKENYPEGVVLEMSNDSLEQLQANCRQIGAWMEAHHQ
ncbi:putative adenylate kinase isoenzyme [Paratrimastix pyriformis]|uniref:Adenylate kinase isoenzyme 6 homolog n=1 Tax=Paratrimastix pyriformis TaxID=342808 RepID=A0ABQ8UL72_9EUKA|nr:putative adenylate kinase isoenzyme [Paratrimastix pyriformis]